MRSANRHFFGNTSTDVEKTQSHHHQLGRRKETPPRTWRRLDRNTVGSQAAGNTSTDVEKTKLSTENLPLKTKHLHGRGEDSETYGLFSRRPRNTSTDVEKTCCGVLHGSLRRKHLHGRGEDVEAKTSTALPSETPPRTWRRLKTTGTEPPRLRNTSTDVEKTTTMCSSQSQSQKHLHGRGEDFKNQPKPIPGRETPPRTWRRQQDLALG